MVRRLDEAARAQYLASEEARHGVTISLISDVTNNYGPLDEVGIGGKLVEQYITEDHAAELHG